LSIKPALKLPILFTWVLREKLLVPESGWFCFRHSHFIFPNGHTMIPVLIMEWKMRARLESDLIPHLHSPEGIPDPEKFEKPSMPAENGMLIISGIK